MERMTSILCLFASLVSTLFGSALARADDFGVSYRYVAEGRDMLGVTYNASVVNHLLISSDLGFDTTGLSAGVAARLQTDDLKGLDCCGAHLFSDLGYTFVDGSQVSVSDGNETAKYETQVSHFGRLAVGLRLRFGSGFYLESSLGYLKHLRGDEAVYESGTRTSGTDEQAAGLTGSALYTGVALGLMF